MTAVFSTEEPVAVLAAPRDAQLACAAISQAGIPCVACNDARAMIDMVMGERVATLVLAEEMLEGDAFDHLEALLASQPTWSDLPIVLVSAGAHEGSQLGALRRLGNATMLTRPMAPDALASAVAAGRRARARQLQVKKLLDEQQDAVRRRDELLMMLAHELRNPLAPMRYAAEALRHPATAEPQRTSAIEVIARQVEHMGGIIDQMLEVFRASRGLQRLELETLSLGQLAHEAVAAHALRHDPPLRFDDQGDAWVRADRGRLRQVIDNLVENALKFTPAGRDIVVRVRREGPDAVLEVQDGGAGLDSSLLERIFEPFAQADTSLDRSGGGLGLGLALVRALVQLHGGEVWAASDGAQKGSTFRVRLPRVEPPEARPLEPAKEPEAPARRVLVAEDNPDAAETLRLLLELHGHDVRVVHDGREAVDAARQDPPEVLVCDIGLPHMTGHEVARALREHPETRHLRLIAVTGYGTPEDRDRALDAGFDSHLSKPVDPTRLIAEISRGAARTAAGAMSR